MRIIQLARKLGVRERDLRREIKAAGFEVDKKSWQVSEEVVAAMEKRYGEMGEEEGKEEKIEEIKISSEVSVKELSERLDKPVAEVIGALMKNGIMATINEEVDFDTAALLAEDFGVRVIEEQEEEVLMKKRGVRKQLLEELAGEDKTKLKRRPPVVAVMGHVDHGKTTLLDAIRETNVVSSESGGITQHIGAYQVQHKGKMITFLDTPGHEAFRAMRERGAKVTDVAVLVVAADDGVKPQTKEAIDFIKSAGVPMVVAINKIDKPEADINRVKKELSEAGVLLEGWGGDVVSVEVSAKKKINIEGLLEMILLVSEIQQLRANPEDLAIGTVVESRKDAERGALATVLVQNGTLKVGEYVVVGGNVGKVKALENYLGKRVDHAKPSVPVLILGLPEAPEVGDILRAVENKEEAWRAIEKSAAKKRPRFKEKGEDKRKLLNVVLKADVQGSMEAILESLEDLGNEEVGVRIVSAGVGKVTESDVMMASSSNAELLAFNTEVTSVVRRLAEDEAVTLGEYKIIYELIDAVKSKLEAMLEPEVIKKELGKLEVLKVFRTERKRIIAGGRVTSGVVLNEALAKIVRQGELIGEGKIENLQMNKRDVSKVPTGKECGIVYVGKGRIKEGDEIQFWSEEKKVKKL